jgi:hypothetical protein
MVAMYRGSPIAAHWWQRYWWGEATVLVIALSLYTIGVVLWALHGYGVLP